MATEDDNEYPRAAVIDANEILALKDINGGWGNFYDKDDLSPIQQQPFPSLILTVHDGDADKEPWQIHMALEHSGLIRDLAVLSHMFMHGPPDVLGDKSEEHAHEDEETPDVVHIDAEQAMQMSQKYHAAIEKFSLQSVKNDYDNGTPHLLCSLEEQCSRWIEVTGDSPNAVLRKCFNHLRDEHGFPVPEGFVERG